MERLSNATIRLLKMKSTEQYIFVSHKPSNFFQKPGLKGKNDCPELTQDFLNVMISAFEINFASLFLEKLLSGGPNPQGIKFASMIASQSIRKAQIVSEGFSRFNTGISKQVQAWCNIAETHFKILTFYSMYQENELMTQRIIEKTKDVETIYFENNILAHRILDLRQNLQSQVDSVGHNDLFNLRDSGMHSLAFINQAQEYNLKK